MATAAHVWHWAATFNFANILWMLLALIATFRLIWFVSYFFIFLLKTPSRPLHSVKKAATELTSSIFPSNGTSEEQADKHRRQFKESLQQFNTSLVIGAVALAAWTQLFTAAESSPGADLSPLTRNLLLISSLLLLVGPSVFRASGRHLTFIGRECTAGVGYSGLVLALSSVLVDLFNASVAAIGIALSVLVSVRDLMETWQQIKNQRQINLPSAGT